MHLTKESFTYTAHIVTITFVQTFCMHPHTTVFISTLDPVTGHISSLWINVLIVQAKT